MPWYLFFQLNCHVVIVFLSKWKMAFTTTMTLKTHTISTRRTMPKKNHSPGASPVRFAVVAGWWRGRRWTRPRNSFRHWAKSLLLWGGIGEADGENHDDQNKAVGGKESKRAIAGFLSFLRLLAQAPFQQKLLQIDAQSRFELELCGSGIWLVHYYCYVKLQLLCVCVCNEPEWIPQFSIITRPLTHEFASTNQNFFRPKKNVLRAWHEHATTRSTVSCSTIWAIRGDIPTGLRYYQS